jgi:hypothetical protein
MGRADPRLTHGCLSSQLQDRHTSGMVSGVTTPAPWLPPRTSQSPACKNMAELVKSLVVLYLGYKQDAQRRSGIHVTLPPAAYLWSRKQRELLLVLHPRGRHSLRAQVATCARQLPVPGYTSSSTPAWQASQSCPKRRGSRATYWLGHVRNCRRPLCCVAEELHPTRVQYAPE